MQGCLLVDSHKSTGSGPVRSPVIFFFSSLADVALRLGPYMSISSEKKFVQRTQLVQMSRQIKPKRQQNTQNHQNTTTRKSPSQTCVSSENAANKTKNQTKHKQKRGRSPKTTPTRSICQGTQWFDHCITFKNMRNELKSRNSRRHESLAC